MKYLFVEKRHDRGDYRDPVVSFFYQEKLMRGRKLRTERAQDHTLARR
jgi:hypothetical protein